MNYSRSTVRNRSKLLKAVKKEVNARLDRSLHNAVRTQLLSESEPEQVQRIWDIEVKIGQRPSFLLPRETKIGEIFAQTGGKLMILGAEGAGKTTTLLELARELISRAEINIEQPIPVSFNISAWSRGNLDLADWLVAEIKSRYGIKAKISKQLMQERQLFPLLDNLSALELSQQELCLQAIEKLMVGANSPKHIVICTRLEDYKSCATKLRLHGAIYLRPLHSDRIREYLMNSRSRELWENIKSEPQLLELAKNPLLLNLMVLAYEEILIHAWKRIDSKPERYNYLLNAYIRRMLVRDLKSRWYRKGKEPRPEQTRHWLIWLAKKMIELNRSEFSIAELDRNWLETPAQKRVYNMGVWLTLGGIAGIKNFLLRFLLWRSGSMPWNYEKFLGLATERLFLQPIDGRYRFVHELLQKHLSQL